MHFKQMYRPIGFLKSSYLSSVSGDKNFSLGGEVVGILVVILGVAMGSGLASTVLVPVSQLWQGPILWPWADCSVGTSELIGEDLLVIIILEFQPIMG